MDINTIMIDTDGVLRDFDSALKEELRLFGMDYVLHQKEYNLNKRYETITKIKDFNMYDFIYKNDTVLEGCFYKAKPYEGAIGFIKDLFVRGYRIILASSQPTREPVKLTIDWYFKHNIHFDEISFLDNKYEREIDVLIDDSHRQIANAVLSRRLFGTPKIIFRFPRPWNENYMDFIKVKCIKKHLPISPEGLSSLAKFDSIIRWLDTNTFKTPDRRGKLQILRSKCKELKFYE